MGRNIQNIGEPMTKQEQEIEEVAEIVHKTLSFYGGPVNDSDRKDAREILTLIEKDYVRKDTEVDCPYCNRPYHTVGCPCVNFKIKVGELMDGMKEKEPECPVCGSPLEDNGNCSDVGNNNCFYTGGMG